MAVVMGSGNYKMHARTWNFSWSGKVPSTDA